MHDGAPAHSSLVVRLSESFFPRRVNWPGWTNFISRKITGVELCEFHLHNLVYSETLVESEAELLLRFRNSCAQMRDRSDMLQKVKNSLIRRSNICINAGGSHVELL